MNEHAQPGPGKAPEAVIRPTRFSILWVIPVLAILISGWLAWQHFANTGPRIVIAFDTADGIVPGQTEVKLKAVDLGVVKDVTLSPNMSHVLVTVQMNARSAPLMTTHGRFWVVRPRINGASITGLDTLFTGAYIAFDPGPPGGERTDHFIGLENPPGIRSDQPGAIYWLVSPELDSLGPGSPVFYRDLNVGEVVGYTMPPGGVGPILLQVFVRAPYDHYLRADSRFWNVSGIQVGFGPGGLAVRLQSLQALFSGGVAFGEPTPLFGVPSPPAKPNTVFRLYASHTEADNTAYRQRLRVATYVDSSVGGLTKGSRVTMFGLQVGVVTGVHMDLGPDGRQPPRVRVDMVIEPGRVLQDDTDSTSKDYALLADFVHHGLHASVQNVSFLTGESMIALAFTHNGKPGHMTWQDGVAIVPSEPGGMDGVLQSVSSIANKISEMPLTQIGNHLNELLEHSDQRVKSPQVTQAIAALRGSLVALNRLLDNADDHLPKLMNALDSTLASARVLLNSYGGDSDFHHDLQALVIQLTQLARSMRLTANYIDHHPSALLVGRHD
ncbi:PqiB family protein [Oecophyllibacter saccharovorans]|uniref:MCE family protein n=1 Tax=Oecophyllibacter saccharovorans TaxID=2558360 RepID=A0A506UMG9_9PROT|nr:MlaD family protein [Oecophyllibacter saccharovorans]QDH16025.1 MCE family protein [Oecophyllibacter saccharovorans]TPW34541.1 MCE family protein [Oecophyllibacter saccharovorans]TPW36796.1 MCE family protein [Oecophyllibacter saccharovorans]